MIKRILLIGTVIVAASFPCVSSAETLTELQTKIANLISQLKEIQVQYESLKTSTSTASVRSPIANIYCPEISRSLSRGMTGSEVRALQDFLVSQGYLTQESVSGFFGPLTEEALQKWQSSQSIVSSGAAAETGWGVFGTKSRERVFKLCGKNVPESVSRVPSVRVISPNGGEVLRPDELQYITWEEHGLGPVDIGLYKNDQWLGWVNTSVTPDGRVSWTPSALRMVTENLTAGNVFKIYIVGRDGVGIVEDMSDAPFAFVSSASMASVTVNGDHDVTFPAVPSSQFGSMTRNQYSVTWSSSNTATCSLSAYKTDGTLQVTQPVPPNTTGSAPSNWIGYYDFSCVDKMGEKVTDRLTVRGSSSVNTEVSPTCTVKTNKQVVPLGDSFTVTWSSTNALYMTGLPTGITSDLSGSQVISPGTPGTYTRTLNFFSGDKKVSCAFSVEVSGGSLPPPPFMIDPLTPDFASTAGNLALYTLWPASGPIGTKVTIVGKGFGAIQFGNYTPEVLHFGIGAVPGLAWAPNQDIVFSLGQYTMMDFTVPSVVDTCQTDSRANELCRPKTSVTNGAHSVYVTNANGESNKLTFTVTSAGNMSGALKVDKVSGKAPLTVKFSHTASPASGAYLVLDYGDGQSYGADVGAYVSPTTTRIYTAPGVYTAKLMELSERCGSNTEFICRANKVKILGTAVIVVSPCEVNELCRANPSQNNSSPIDDAQKWGMNTGDQKTNLANALTALEGALRALIEKLRQ